MQRMYGGAVARRSVTRASAALIDGEHRVFCEALLAALRATLSLDAVGTAGSLAEALEELRRTPRQDLVLVELSGPDADQLRIEVRGRRLTLLVALCTLVRDGGRVTNTEEVILGRAVDVLMKAHVLRVEREAHVAQAEARLAEEDAVAQLQRGVVDAEGPAGLEDPRAAILEEGAVGADRAA